MSIEIPSLSEVNHLTHTLKERLKTSTPGSRSQKAISNFNKLRRELCDALDLLALQAECIEKSAVAQRDLEARALMLSEELSLQRSMSDTATLSSAVVEQLSDSLDSTFASLQATLLEAINRHGLNKPAQLNHASDFSGWPADDSATSALEEAQGKINEQSERIRLLEQELDDKQIENSDLGSQNLDLAAQLAKLQVTASTVLTSNNSPHLNFSQEGLTWEQRRDLIMRQLEGESEETELDQHARLEIEQVVATTQSEIELRDQHIAELQSIIEQQSNTREGVAIGAAAIAQMFDSDELVQQERKKLQDIQQQWEEKVRQAEIDISLERAKLARERLQLETELEEAKKTTSVQYLPAAGETKAETRTRKWLEHLGIGRTSQA
ncbi:MAG: hypothetical protein R3C53_09670 [Pirellulaceae bacterium]